MRPDAARGGGLALLAILLVGAAIHLPFLGSASLWLDEGLTLVPAMHANSLPALIADVRAVDTQPPISHLVLYFLRDILPAGEFGLRLPSFLALQIGLVFMFLVIRRVWDTPTAILAAALAQISPYLAFYGAEARNYGLWLAAAGASWWLLVRWSGERAARVGWVALWGLVNGLGLLVHLFHLFAIASQCATIGAIALAEPRGPERRRLLVAGVAGTLVAFLLFLPWAMALSTHAGAGMAGVATAGVVTTGAGTAGVNWTRPLTLKTVAALPYVLALGFSWGPGLREAHTIGMHSVLRLHGAAVVAAAIVLALVLVAAVRFLSGRESRATPADRIAFLLIPAAGLAGPLGYAFVTHFPLHPRHLMFLAPLAPLLLARLILTKGPGRWAAAALVTLQIGALFNLRADPAYAKDDERGAVRFAEQHSTGKACIIGDVAPLYVVQATGLIEQFTELSDPRQCGSIVDLWWVENRPWEDPDGRARRKLARAARDRGLEPAGTEDRFAGVTLHHWQRVAAEEGDE